MPMMCMRPDRLPLLAGRRSARSEGTGGRQLLNGGGGGMGRGMLLGISHIPAPILLGAEIGLPVVTPV